MISYSHKFIFVHIPKTAGTSIEEILKTYSENIIVYDSSYYRNIKRGISKIIDPNIHSQKHSPLSYYKMKLPEDFYNSCFKFSCVRNPWSRAISYYFFKMTMYKDKKLKKIRRIIANIKKKNKSKSERILSLLNKYYMKIKNSEIEFNSKKFIKIICKEKK